jgi:hypothetical protein
MRTVMNSLSTPEIVLIFVGGSVVLAVSLAIIIRWLAPDIAEREFEELASGLRVVYELMFALILAFAIASVIDKFNSAESTVDTEATALSQMLRANRAFPIDLQSRLRDGISNYVFATIDDEWHTMREGKPSREAAAALDTVYALYQGYTPAGVVAGKFYDQALAHLDVVATSRRERLGISNSRLPLILVLMLPVGALLLLVLEYRPHLRPRGQAAFMGTLAVVLSSTYLLTIVLDYPFSGDVSVSNQPLKSGTLAYLVNSPPRTPQAGDKPVKLTAAMLDGVFISDNYGTVVLRHDGNVIHGVYRTARGFVRGVVGADGVFRGAWCEGSQLPARHDGGILEWRLIQTKSGERVIDGRWEFGYVRRLDGTFVPFAGWDMHVLKKDQAQDLQARLAAEPESRFCHMR